MTKEKILGYIREMISYKAPDINNYMIEILEYLISTGVLVRHIFEILDNINVIRDFYDIYPSKVDILALISIIPCKYYDVEELKCDIINNCNYKVNIWKDISYRKTGESSVDWAKRIDAKISSIINISVTHDVSQLENIDVLSHDMLVKMAESYASCHNVYGLVKADLFDF